MSVDIATLGLEVRSDGVVVAGKHLQTLQAHGKKTEVGLRANFKKVELAADRLAKRFFSLQSAMLGLGVGLAVLDITKTGAAFEQTMIRVKAVANATAKEFQGLNNISREMGEKTEWSASQAADALQFLSMAGFKASQSIGALPGVLDLATAGSIDLGRAADIASNVLTSMRLQVSDLTRVNDVFIKTMTTSNVNMEMMSESFKYAGSIGAAFGYTVEQISGYIGMLGNAGIQGSMAGTQLAMSFTEVSKVFKHYNKLGVDTSKYTKNLGGAMKLLEDRSASAQEVLDLFGQRAGRGVAALMGIGTEAIEKYIKTLEDADGTTKRVADEFRNSTIGRWKELQSVIESVKIDIFEGQAGSLNETLRDMSAYIRENKDDILAFADAAAETFKSLSPVAGLIASTFKDALDGFNSLPEFIKSAGILGSLVFGKEGVVIVAALAWTGQKISEIMIEVDKTFSRTEHARQLAITIAENKARNAVHEYTELYERVERYQKLVDKGVLKPEQIVGYEKELETMYRRLDMFHGEMIKKLKLEYPEAANLIADSLKKIIPESDKPKVTVEDFDAINLINEKTKAIQHQIEMLSESERAQYIDNFVRKEGIDITKDAGKALQELVGDYYDAQKAQEAATKANEAFMDFMSIDDQANAAKIRHDAAMEIQADIDKIRKSLSEPFEFKFADEGLSGIANMINGVNNLTEAWKKHQEQLKEVGEANAENAQLIADINNKAITDQLAGYSNLFGVMSNFYEEGSSQREALHKLEMGFAVAELAMQAEKIALSTVEFAMNAKNMAVEMAGMATRTAASLAYLAIQGASAVLTQGQGDPYTAWARMAGMAALVGGIIAAAGGAFNGGGGSGSPKIGAPAPTTGTVLGDPKAESESLANSFEMLEDYNELQYIELKGIYDQVKALNQNLTGIANAVVRSVGTFDAADFPELNFSAIKSDIEEFMDSTVGKATTYMMDTDKALGDVLNKIGGENAKYVTWGMTLRDDIASKTIKYIGEGLFGKISDPVLQKAGIEIGAITIRDILDGIQTSITQYAVSKSTQSSWFSDSDIFSEARTTGTEELKDLEVLWTKLYVASTKSLMDFADVFGVTADEIKEHVNEIQTIDFSGWTTGDEITEGLNAWFSTFMDVTFKDVFKKVLEPYQDPGEGLMETATRLIVQVESVDKLLVRIGKSFDFIGMKAIDVADQFIESAGGAENFIDAVSGVYELFISEGQKLRDTRKDLSESLKYIGETTINAQNFPSTVEMYNSDKEFYDAFIWGVLPDSKEGFFRLAEAIDVSDDAGRKAYLSFLGLADGLNEVFDAAEEINNVYKEMNQDLEEALHPLSSLNATYKDIREQAAENEKEWVSHGMAVDVAHAKTQAWTDSMIHAAFVTQNLIDRDNLRIAILQAEGKELAVLNIERQNERDAILDLYSATPAAGAEIVKLTDYLWELQDAAKNKELFNNIRDMLFNITGDESLLTKTLEDIQKELAGAESGNYGQQFNLLTDQYNVLTQIRDLQENQLKETIASYEAIEDTILSLQGGDLAPIQSKEFFERRYEQLLAAAQGGDSNDISTLNSFISQYANFMKAYNGYSDFTAGIIADMENLQDNISGGATLDDLYTQLESLDTIMNPVVTQLAIIANLLVDSPSKMMFPEGTNWSDLPADQWMERNSRLTNIEGFASGGSASGIGILGERGMEMVNFGSGAQVYSNRDTVDILASAISKALSFEKTGSASISEAIQNGFKNVKADKNGEVHAHIHIGHEVRDYVIGMLETDKEAQYQVKRIKAA